MNQQSDVSAFMRSAKQDVPAYPTIQPLEVRILRAKLILEEAFEQCAALGVAVLEPDTKYPILPEEFYYEEGEAPNLTKIAAGSVDQIYVSIGSCCAFGLNIEKVWTLVQAANMAKFGPGSHFRPDGKVQKPAGWLPPDADITDELKRQCKEGNGL